jgi:hypothetical protein
LSGINGICKTTLKTKEIAKKVKAFVNSSSPEAFRSRTNFFGEAISPATLEIYSGICDNINFTKLSMVVSLSVYALKQLQVPNARPELLPEAGAQRTLEAVSSRPLFGEPLRSAHPSA